MSEDTHTTSRRPSHTLWFAPKRESAHWVAVGSLWPTKSGTGFNVILELVPRAEGSLVALPFKEAAEKAGED